MYPSSAFYLVLSLAVALTDISGRSTLVYLSSVMVHSLLVPLQASDPEVVSSGGCKSCVVSGGAPDIVLATHSGRPTFVYLSSVLVHSLLVSLQASDREVVSSGGCKSYIGEDK